MRMLGPAGHWPPSLFPHTITLCLKLGGVRTWVVVISKVEEVGANRKSLREMRRLF